MSEIVKIQRLGKELVIAIPTEICERLSFQEGSEIDIEPFNCGGEFGARIKLKK